MLFVYGFTDNLVVMQVHFLCANLVNHAVLDSFEGGCRTVAEFVPMQAFQCLGGLDRYIRIRVSAGN